jgi:Flp pilus assembly protein TadD
MKAVSWLIPAACFLVGMTAVMLLHSSGGRAPAPVPTSTRSPQVEEHMALAREHLAAQRIIEAHAEAIQAEALAPQDARVQSLLGDVADASLRKEAAERYYRRATELDPNHVVARANLALVLLDLGQTREALEHAQRAFAGSDPDDPRYKALLGRCLLMQGRAKEAAPLLQASVEQGVGYAAPFLGRALDLAGQSDAALRVFDESLRHDPTDPQVHYWRAECLRHLGREAEAQEALAAQKKHLALRLRIARVRELLLVHDPGNVSLLVDLAGLLLDQGNVDAARATLDRASNLSPDNQDVRRLRARLPAARG